MSRKPGYLILIHTSPPNSFTIHLPESSCQDDRHFHHDRAQPRVHNDSQHRTNWIQTPCSLSSKTFLNWLHLPSQSDLAQIFKLCQTHPSLSCVSGSFPITGCSIVSRTLCGKYLPQKNYVTQSFPKSLLSYKSIVEDYLEKEFCSHIFLRNSYSWVLSLRIITDI